MIKLSIVIVNWNVVELLSNCLISIAQRLEDVAYEVIVIDNNSGDNSVGIIRAKFPWVTVIENKENAGFARANNQGFAIARGEFILILNPDTILREQAVQRMMHVLGVDSKIGIVGPRIVTENGEIDRSCKREFPNFKDIFINSFLIAKAIFFFTRMDSFFKKFYYKKFYISSVCACLTGACMLTKKLYLEKVGFFDETLPMYLDDIDLCYRFNKAGFLVYYSSEAEILHIRGSSTKKTANAKLFDLMTYRARDIFFSKHKNILYVVFHRLILLCASLFSILIDILLLPVLVLLKRPYLEAILSKHLFTFWYCLTGRITLKHF